MAVCSRCSHFRRVRPASDLLARSIGTREAPVATGLGKIVEDEQKLREAEAGIKQSKASIAVDEWATRPAMTEYCGLREYEDVYLIAEVKNRDGACQDFSETRPPKRPCATCAHRVKARGFDQDRALEQEYAQMSVDATIAQTQGGGQSLLDSHRQAVGARQSFELSAVYSSQGRMATLPSYFDHCAHFSDEEDFVICALENRHGTCQAWVPAGEGDAPLPSEAVDASLDLLMFMNSVVNGTDVGTPSSDARARWAQDLAGQYASLPTEVCSWLRTTPTVVADIRAAWPEMPPKVKETYRQQWARDLEGIAPVLGAVRPPGGAEATSAGPSVPRPAVDLLDEIIAGARAEEERLAQHDPQLSFQKKLHNDQQHAALMSAMMKSMHEASMSIVRNMGS